MHAPGAPLNATGTPPVPRVGRRLVRMEPRCGNLFLMWQRRGL
jgi:hypothetical protein